MPLIRPALNRPVAIATDMLWHLPFGPRLVTSVLGRNAADPDAAYRQFTYGPER
jgi:hypothetical protein